MNADSLAAYLTATRTGRPDALGAGSVAYYRPLVEFCRSTIKPPPSGHPNVALIYTLSRRSELVSLDGDFVLIHDQHLGQTLATCLRILITAPDFKAKLRFFSRVLAEESLSIGDAAGAATGFLTAANLNQDWARVPKSITKPEIVIEATLQELFVIAHEYCHLLMSVFPEFAASRRRVGDMLIENKLQKLKRADGYADMEARYPGVCSFEAFTEVVDRQTEFFEDNADLMRTEAACDDFALNALVHRSRTSGAPLRHVFRAAFLALRHMRAIHYIRDCVSPIKARSNVGESRTIRLLQGREHALRGVMALAAEKSGFTGQLNEVWDELAELSDRQDREIDLPLLTEIIPAFAKARNRTARKRRWSFDDVEKIAESVNWRIRSRLIDHKVI